LSAHLRQTEGHTRLPFHPACPICRRERLAGDLPSDALVSPRTQAAIAAGLLAFSSVAPGAVAAETDQTSEGTAVPEQVAGGDGAQSPGFDPGGESVDLPVEAPVAPQVPVPPAADDAEPLEPEPAVDVAPVADRGEVPAPSEVGPPPSVVEPPGATTHPEASMSPGRAPEEPAGGGAKPETTDAPVTKRPTARSDGEARRSTPRPTTRSDAELRRSTPRRVASAVDRRHASAPVHAAQPTRMSALSSRTPVRSSSTPTTTSAAVHPTTAPAPTVVVAGAAAGRAKPGDRFHVVRRGESLWSIAADVLGENATVARIAREVNRLWRLNEERIATGDRNLLLVGTRLRLK
jgi:nucleoid-associated protein YgaU